MRERLQVWWRSRSDREHRFLAAWGAVTAALLMWFGGVSPLAQRIAVLEKRVPELEGQLMRMQASRRSSHDWALPPVQGEGRGGDGGHKSAKPIESPPDIPHPPPGRPIANVASATFPLEGGGVDAQGVRGSVRSNGGDLRSALLGVLAERGIRAELNPLASSRVEMRLPELPLRDAFVLIDALRQESAARVARLEVQVDAQPGGVARTIVELERAR